MKKLLFIVVASMITFAACNSGSTSKKTSSKEENLKSVVAPAITIDNLMKDIDKKVGKDVVIKGMVTHVCSHSGRRCFLTDSAEKVSIRVESGGEINGFNKELSGSEIIVKGKVQEKRLTSEYINEFEVKVKAKKDTENGGEHCNAELANIKKMRDWMKEHGKDYYPVYFINGESYEEIVE